jgi:hypothetical protein
VQRGGPTDPGSRPRDHARFAFQLNTPPCIRSLFHVAPVLVEPVSEDRNVTDSIVGY